jgi:hypothetical protein
MAKQTTKRELKNEMTLQEILKYSDNAKTRFLTFAVIVDI